MKLRFVSHASFSVESGGVKLICDPWLFGKAFNRGWALLSPAASVNWEEIDYLWISHQHPDHLHFPTLKSIPSDQRHRITVLYQKHASERIPKVLRGLGFSKVQELKLNKWVSLRGGIEVLCGSVGSMDSWIAIRAERMTILNLNDCVMEPRHLGYVSKLVGRVNLLLTQFSFANWIGNHSDELGEVEAKLQDLRFRVTFLKPDVTIPFASFIYFCNEENKWMNEFAVTPRQVINEALPGINFMYPGDEWDSGIQRFRSDEAVERYMDDIARPKAIDATPDIVSVQTIARTIDRTLRLLRSRFGRFLINRIKPFSIYLHDLDMVMQVNPAGSCKVQQADKNTRQSARYVMCSQLACFAFAYSWGWAAMDVSGMYFDRRFKETNALAFYLNLLSTECLDFAGLRPTMRTLTFLWAKRRELLYRLLAFLRPSGTAAVQGRSQERAIA
jgi:UDP-MurNAc hydroxylase